MCRDPGGDGPHAWVRPQEELGCRTLASGPGSKHSCLRLGPCVGEDSRDRRTRPSPLSAPALASPAQSTAPNLCAGCAPRETQLAGGELGPHTIQSQALCGDQVGVGALSHVEPLSRTLLNVSPAYPDAN